MEKLLTVVIPTYNMELYLEKCLDSLIMDEESMSLLEVLVVNDGSKDGSSAIAHTFADRYPDTFIVIDKENGNYGSCINVGLQRAAGWCFRILDADDTYDTEAFQSFIKDLLKCDADWVSTPFRQTGKDFVRLKSLPETIECGREYELSALKRTDLMLFMHATTFKTSLLQDIHLRLDEGVSYTDVEFCFFPLQYVRTVEFFNHEVYQYNAARDGQTMSDASLKRSTSSMDVVDNRFLDYYLANVDAVPQYGANWTLFGSRL